MSAAVALVLTVMSLPFAAAASADIPLEGEDKAHQQVVNGEGNAEAAETRPPRHPAESPTGDDAAGLWLWTEVTPGHDKCKRRKAWPLPLWCFGLSRWPVMKAQAVTATVLGIHEGGNVRRPSRTRVTP
jgi:hypothetical protein